jgi:hypothetical protein
MGGTPKTAPIREDGLTSWTANRISRYRKSRSMTRSWSLRSRPIVALLLGLSSITVPWDTLILSVVLYIVVPVLVAQLVRQVLLASGGPAALANTLHRLAPLSLSALLLTLVLLFGLQGEQITLPASLNSRFMLSAGIAALVSGESP